jgi:hypothetical protein
MIIKFNLWKIENYWTISIIIFTFIILFYQTRLYYICYYLHKEAYTSNVNQVFKLYDRSNDLPSQIQFRGGDAPTAFDWEDPLKFGTLDGQNTYDKYNSNDNKICDKDKIIQLTELASVAIQQLQDASATYYSLVDVYKNLAPNKPLPTCLN